MNFAIARPAAKTSEARANQNEFYLVFIALLLTAIVPSLAKYRTPDAPPTSLLGQIIWSLMYVAAALRLYALRERALPLLARSGSLWLFLSLMFVSVLWSVEPETTFKNSIELIGTTIIAFYIVSRFTLLEFVGIFSLAFTAIAFISLAFVFGAPGHGRMDWGAGAWEGIYSDKNNLGAAAALAIISQAVLLRAARGRMRRIAFLGLILFVGMLLGSNSATALVDCVGVLVTMLAAFACRAPRFAVPARIFTAIGGSLVVMAVVLFGVTPDSLYGLLGRSSTLTGRTDFWPYLQQAVTDRPWFGYGYDAFFRSATGLGYLSDYIVQAGGWTPYHAHNSFLQVELDGGYVGEASLFLLLGVAIWRGIRYFAREPSSSGTWPLAIVVFLILGSFTETYFGNWNSLEWILFVAALLYPIKNFAPRRAAPDRVPRRFTSRGKR